MSAKRSYRRLPERIAFVRPNTPQGSVCRTLLYCFIFSGPWLIAIITWNRRAVDSLEGSHHFGSAYCFFSCAMEAHHIPDPFQIEDSDESLSSEETASTPPARTPAISASATHSPLPHDVPLGSPHLTANVSGTNSRVALTPIGGNSPLPRLPGESDSSVPALFLPGLISPSLFLPIPNVSSGLYNLFEA